MSTRPDPEAFKAFLAPFGRLRLWPAIGTVIAAGGFWLIAYVSGVDFSFWQLVLLALAALAGYSVVTGMRADTERPPDLVVRSVNEPSWRPFTEVNRWEDRLIFAEAKPGRFATTNANEQLRALAAERLRLRRGLSLADEPDQSRALLGERTYRFLTEPVPHCPTPAQLGEHLKAIEEI